MSQSQTSSPFLEKLDQKSATSAHNHLIELARVEGLTLVFASNAAVVRQITGPGLAHIAWPRLSTTTAADVAWEAVQGLNDFLQTPISSLAIATSEELPKHQHRVTFSVKRNGLVVEDSSISVLMQNDSVIEVTNYSYAELEVEPMLCVPEDVEMRLRSQGLRSIGKPKTMYRVVHKDDNPELVLAYLIELIARNGQRAAIYVNSKSSELFDLRRN